MIGVYTTGHAHSETVSAAMLTGLAELGLAAAKRKAAPLDPGDSTVVMYGFLRGLLPTLRDAQGKGRPWVYLDNGYFRSSDHASNRYDGFYRVTRNRYQHPGIVSGDATVLARGEKRFRGLGLEIRPERAGRLARTGCHILVVPPGETFANAMGFLAGDWLNGVLVQLDRVTDRPVKVRRKGSPVPLAEDLADCHAVVTYGSAVAFAALLAAVPVVCDPMCAAFPLAWSAVGGGLHDIDNAVPPSLPEREAWAYTLAANQWTLAELRSGQCWRELTGGVAHG
ncbi:MAG: hypothetical protein AB7F67_03870 [Rhodospirillaceae bacterium]